MITWHEAQQGTDEWLTARRGIITASVVGRLLTPTGRVASNDHSRAFPFELAAERITGTSEYVFVNDDMQRGNLHEPIARDKYADTNGVTVQQVGFMVRDDWGFPIGYSPDGLVDDDGLLEVKGHEHLVRALPLLRQRGVRVALLLLGDGPLQAELERLARDLGVGQTCRVPPLGFSRDKLRDLPIVPMERVVTPWYLRMEVEDKPGVLSKVASIFSDQGISIEALTQKAPAEGQTRVQLIVITNNAVQGSMDKAVAAIEALDTIAGKVTRIRVEELDG